MWTRQSNQIVAKIVAKLVSLTKTWFQIFAQHINARYMYPQTLTGVIPVFKNLGAMFGFRIMVICYIPLLLTLETRDACHVSVIRRESSVGCFESKSG